MPATPPMRAARRAALLSLAAAWLLPWPHAASAASPPAEVASALPGAALQGSGRLTFLGLRIYDARLWSDDSFRADTFERTPLAIELNYARTLRGTLIAERSLKEMRRAGPIADDEAARWLATMTQLFPDVNAGDRITGVLRPGESAHFFLNGKPLGEVRDADFATRFFGIWLSPKTSEPALRQALLGKAGP